MTAFDRAQPAPHDHVFLAASHDENARRTLVVVVLTAVAMVGEIVAGLVFNSMALLADGFHMATHAGALGIAAGAYAFARRHARDRRYSFGTGKVGDLAGFASGLVLGLVALGIAFESSVRLLQPQAVAFGEATVVAVLGLLVNIVCATVLGGGHAEHGHHHDHGHSHRHAHAHHPPHEETRHRDNNMRAAFAHVVADAFTSLLAIAALLAGRFLGWTWLDPVMGLVGAALIALWSIRLMRDAAAVLLDTTDPTMEARILDRIGPLGDAEITDLHIWRVGPGAHAVILSIAGPVDADAIRSRLASMSGLAHVTVET